MQFIAWLTLTIVGVSFVSLLWHIKRAYPHRSFRRALHYWYPQRLTLKHNPRIHAWFWWNF